MLEKEINESVSEIKDPERKINIITAMIVVSALWAALLVVSRIAYNNVISEKKQAEAKSDSWERKYDSIIAIRYQDARNEVDVEKIINDFRNYQDSTNRELRILKEKLTSK